MEEKTPDLGAVLNVLGEHPELIGKIRALLAGENTEPRSADALPDPPPDAEGETVAAATVPIGAVGRLMTARREHLLFALKPYLSSERAQAIDTAVNLARILDTIRIK